MLISLYRIIAQPPDKTSKRLESITGNHQMTIYYSIKSPEPGIEPLSVTFCATAFISYLSITFLTLDKWFPNWALTEHYPARWTKVFCHWKWVTAVFSNFWITLLLSFYIICVLWYFSYIIFVLGSNWPLWMLSSTLINKLNYYFYYYITDPQTKI
jgi:hypothetical protein